MMPVNYVELVADRCDQDRVKLPALFERPHQFPHMLLFRLKV
jgi:hypothetical protein